MTEYKGSRVRSARRDEAAQRSKASWGYDAEFVADCAPSLTLRSEQMQRQHVFVIEGHERIADFGRCAFIERSAGVERVRIEPEPCAEVFYRTMSAERAGDVPSDAIAGRSIPLLTCAVQQRTEFPARHGLTTEPPRASCCARVLSGIRAGRGLPSRQVSGPLGCTHTSVPSAAPRC